MTYGEAGTARTAIGSGLVNHGIPKVSDWMPSDTIVFLVFCKNGKGKKE